MNRQLDTAKKHYRLPLFDLIYEAHKIHRAHHDPNQIQKCTLLSIKTGGCPEDCGYCPQSAHYETGLAKQELLSIEKVQAAAKNAKANGADRFCMGAAWRNVKHNADFEHVLEMIRVVKSEGLEACATLGMLAPSQAARLKDAGLDAYNHNLDTSREHYKNIIKTRTYDDRLQTIQAVSDAGISVCCGGILGLGESGEDRCALIAELASLDPQPESVPINLLVAVDGTPLQNEKAVDPLDLVRTVAVTRLLLPKARIRLSAGRLSLSSEAQVLAFFAGANSIFLGEKLLTRSNPTPDEDHRLLASLTGEAAHVSSHS
ncbi:MAG: biotin synthase BioB [Bdellovibrionota bacterium]